MENDVRLDPKRTKLSSVKTSGLFICGLRFFLLVSVLCLFFSPPVFALYSGSVQLGVPSPHPVKAGDKLIFQVILVNTGTEKWSKGEYYLRAEIYDGEKKYLTRTESIRGEVDVEPGGSVSLYIPFLVPANYSGTYFWKLVVSYLKETILVSEYYDFSVAPIAPVPKRPLPVKIGGNLTTSYENSTHQTEEDYMGNMSLNLIGRFFDRTFSLNVYAYETVGGVATLDTVLFNYYSPLFTLSAGDIMPRFNSLTLYALGALGGSIVTPGRFSTGLVVARSQEAAKGSTTSDGAFSRYVYGLQEQIKVTGNLIINTSYVYSDDDENSLDRDKDEWGPNLTPVKNGVWGGGVEWKIDGIELSGEFAYGTYWENTVDNPKGKVGDYGFKLESSLEKGKLSFAGLYQRIEPDFHSLACPDITNDREGYEITAGYQELWLADISLGFQHYRDNLDNVSGEVTSFQSILRTGINLNITDLSDVTLGYSLNSTVAKPRSALDNSTQSYSIGFSYNGRKFSLSLNGQLSDFRDKTGSSNDLSTLTGSTSLLTHLTKSLSVTAGATLTRTKDLDDSSLDKSQSYSITANWELIPGRLTLSQWVSLVLTESNDVDAPLDNITADASIELSYTWKPGLTLTIGYKFDGYTDEIDSTSNYAGHGFIARIGLSF